LLYGKNHPYGYCQQLEDFDFIEKGKLINFHKTHYVPSGCKIIVSGKPDKNIVSILNQYFGNKHYIQRKATSNQYITLNPILFLKIL